MHREARDKSEPTEDVRAEKDAIETLSKESNRCEEDEEPGVRPRGVSAARMSNRVVHESDPEHSQSKDGYETSGYCISAKVEFTSNAEVKPSVYHREDENQSTRLCEECKSKSCRDDVK